jgi:hypothetical protein
MSTDRYTSPLSERYASKEMQYIFSQDMKFTTWIVNRCCYIKVFHSFASFSNYTINSKKYQVVIGIL